MYHSGNRLYSLGHHFMSTSSQGKILSVTHLRVPTPKALLFLYLRWRSIYDSFQKHARFHVAQNDFWQAMLLLEFRGAHSYGILGTLLSLDEM